MSIETTDARSSGAGGAMRRAAWSNHREPAWILESMLEHDPISGRCNGPDGRKSNCLERA